MEDYLLTNISITGLTLIGFIFLKNAPARMRLYLLMAALVAWLIPWKILAISSPLGIDLLVYNQDLFDFSFKILI